MSRAVIAEHTIDTALLTPGGWVLDAGCRDFGFSRGLAALGCRVVALDADPTVEDPKEDGIAFRNVAISDRVGMRTLIMHVDPQARYLAVDHNPQVDADRRAVAATTVSHLMAEYGVLRWDAVKLDVEGSEYDILRAWPGPIATQLSIEFHEHCAPRPQRVYDEIFHHLAGFGYEVVQHEKTARYCAHPNFWDSLLILKE